MPGPRAVHHLGVAAPPAHRAHPAGPPGTTRRPAAADTKDFQARYALRAGIEGTIRQGVAITGMRRARYRGLDKTRMEHTYAAVALNLIRLGAWWNCHPLDRTRTSHLAYLELELAS